MPVILSGAGAIVGCYVLIVTTIFLSQRRILFQPDASVPDLARAGVPEAREMTVTTTDGLPLLAWYMQPMRDDAPVVLYLHGNAGHIGHRAYRLGPYHQLGWGVLLLEYRGYGGNSGRPSEAGLITDARGGLAALRAMGLAPDRIVLWGESLGSGLAVRLAVEQAVGAVVLEAPYTSITDIARARFPFVPVSWLALDRFGAARRTRANRSGRDGTRDLCRGACTEATLDRASGRPHGSRRSGGDRRGREVYRAGHFIRIRRAYRGGRGIGIASTVGPKYDCGSDGRERCSFSRAATQLLIAA